MGLPSFLRAWASAQEPDFWLLHCQAHVGHLHKWLAYIGFRDCAPHILNSFGFKYTRFTKQKQTIHNKIDKIDKNERMSVHAVCWGVIHLSSCECLTMLSWMIYAFLPLSKLIFPSSSITRLWVGAFFRDSLLSKSERKFLFFSIKRVNSEYPLSFLGTWYSSGSP